MSQHTRLTALAAAVFAALALAACDQSPSSRTTASVTPPRSTDSSPMAPQTNTTPAPSTAMNSQAQPVTDKIASATDDAAVTTKVKAALLAEPGLRSMEIHVDTKDGVVTLTGTPDSSAVRDKAVVVARNVAGVKEVVDQMASKS